MKILSIVGARPQFVKIAPLVRAIERRDDISGTNLMHVLLHTGQHYDAAMSDVFFEDLALPEAHYNLGVGSGSHGAQTGRMLAQIEQVLFEAKPDAVIVYGDTNSTIAGALASAKLHIPVAHVESGLRSFRRDMPEEINRIVSDHVCDLLLAPTAGAVRNLDSEGLGPRTAFSGDLMYDAVSYYGKRADAHSSIGTRLGIAARPFSVATIHRAENTDNLANLHSILVALNQIAAQGVTIIFPVHPRTRQRIQTDLGHWTPHERIQVIDPVRYLDMLWMLKHASVVLTDSGGLQKEAIFLGSTCVTLREETEWTETVEMGGNLLAGTDVSRILAAFEQSSAVTSERRRGISERAAAQFGGGKAADNILSAVIRLMRDGDATAAAASQSSSRRTADSVR